MNHTAIFGKCCGFAAASYRDISRSAVVFVYDSWELLLDAFTENEQSEAIIGFLISVPSLPEILPGYIVILVIDPQK